MSDVLDLTWGELFSALGMSPGTRATVDPYVYKKEAFTSVSQLNQSYNKNQRMTILTDLLSPFFLPHIGYNDVFEIVRAGESSAHMFRLFQERWQISSVLHICKRIKAENLTNICHMGPIVLLDTIASLFDHSNGQPSDADDRKNIDHLEEVTNHLYSHFAHTSAASNVKCFAEACLNSNEVVIAGSDLIHILQSMVAWPLLKCDDLSWAKRHDEVALRLKNLNLPGIESRQRQAAAMMEEAIVAFDQAGAVNDAAIARSNLGNLISTAAWLTVDQRARRATALYDAAIEGAEEPHFRALLKDNIAGNFGRAANLGLPVPARKGVELAKQAAAELEALGETERLPLVLTNVANHLLQLRDDRTNRARDLREAREFAARGLELLQAAARGVDPTQVRYVQHLLADITVRLADYDKPEAKERAFEAARLLSDSSKFANEERRTDLLSRILRMTYRF
jgi:hypothetical protein